MWHFACPIRAYGFAEIHIFIKPTLKGFALADNPFAYILVTVLKNARSNVVTLLVSILFRLMSCGFVVSTLSSRQCTRILICLLSGTNCPLSFCFSSKSLLALFYKNSLSFKGFCGSLCTAFSCTILSLVSVCTLTLCKFSQ